MKNKLEYLTKVSLDRKLKTKWFLIANIVLALIIVAVTNIDSIIQLFGGDFDNATKVYVIDETGSYDLLKNQIESITTSIYGKENVSFEVSKYDKTEEQVKKEIEKDNNIVAFIIKPDTQNVLNVSLISEAYIDTISMQILEQAINATKVQIAIQNSNISEEELNKIFSCKEMDNNIIELEPSGF